MNTRRISWNQLKKTIDTFRFDTDTKPMVTTYLFHKDGSIRLDWDTDGWEYHTTITLDATLDEYAKDSVANDPDLPFIPVAEDGSVTVYDDGREEHTLRFYNLFNPFD